MMKASAVATRVVSLMAELSVSASLSDQVNWVHAHHTSQKTMTSPKHSDTGEIVRQHRRDLGHGENEDQIEEQLHEGGALFRSRHEESESPRSAMIREPGGTLG